MKIVVYLYTDPLLETMSDINEWGWDVDKIYQDVGERTHLEQLLRDCEYEGVKYVLLRRLCELGDTVAQVNERRNQLEMMGVIIIATEQSYTSNSRQVCDQLLELLQEIQYEQRSRRIRQGHAINRLEGSPPPGKSPYGYRRGQNKYIIDRTTAPVVKDFFENFLLYGSLRGSVKYIGKKYNKNISVTTAKRWLTNPVYRGDTMYHNGEVISNTHTGIISREEGAQIDRLLARNSRLPARSASVPRSLAGLVFCNQCQLQMTISRVTQRYQNQEYLYLRNVKCPLKPKCAALAYEEVLEKTIHQVCQDLPVAVARVNFPPVDVMKTSLENAIARQQQILAQLPSLVETGILDGETANLRVYKIRTEISQFQSKLAALPPVNLLSVAQTVSLPQFWLDLSEVERRFYLREFIRKIMIIREGKEWYLQIIFIF
ncbi:recombinase family protein [Anabaena sp. FACHB-1237]|uniref:recombinase family protein n=1 Tax=Anabaena sp. FACHB-1237 TaxID=2692769 RepID=UPI0016815AC4|nr:recombinase family protein [Anabaena sp. FACHB-1237]MBD2138167.1 recombinase family protein [Anabaena sp. FACHB-1237]